MEDPALPGEVPPEVERRLREMREASARLNEERLRRLPGPPGWSDGAFAVVDRADNDDLEIVPSEGLPDDERFVVRCRSSNVVAQLWVQNQFEARDGDCRYMFSKPAKAARAALTTTDLYLKKALERDPALAERVAERFAALKAEMIAAGELEVPAAGPPPDPRDPVARAVRERLGERCHLRRAALRRRFPELDALLPDRAAYLAQFKGRSELGGREVVVPLSFWTREAIAWTERERERRKDADREEEGEKRSVAPEGESEKTNAAPAEGSADDAGGEQKQ